MGLPAIVLGIISILSAIKVKKMSLNNKFDDSALAGFICSLVNIGYFVATALIFVFVFITSFIMGNQNI